jgi:hypothetical protein
VLRVRRSIRNARSPSVIATTTATRDTRRESWAFPPTKIHHPSLCGAVMSPAPRLTGATCRGHPRRCRSVVPRCRRRAGRGRWGATRLWGRAHVRRLPLPEWAFGRPAPIRRPAGRALPNLQDLHPARSIPLGGQRSIRCLSASSMTVQIGRTLTPCRGAGRGGGRQIRRRCQARHRWRNRALPHDTCNRCLSGAAGPDVHVPLIVGEGHSPTSAVAEAGETAPERMVENVAAV